MEWDIEIDYIKYMVTNFNNKFAFIYNYGYSNINSCDEMVFNNIYNFRAEVEKHKSIDLRTLLYFISIELSSTIKHFEKREIPKLHMKTDAFAERKKLCKAFVITMDKIPRIKITDNSTKINRINMRSEHINNELLKRINKN